MKGVFSILDTKASKVEILGLLAMQRGLSHYPAPPHTLKRVGFYSSEVSLLGPEVGQADDSRGTRLTTQDGGGDTPFCLLSWIP